jgi:perosamine synthetase
MNERERLAIEGGSVLLQSPVRYRWPPIDSTAVESVLQQLSSGLSIYDRSGVVRDFEERFATLHNRRHGLITSSGTAALHSVYYALGIGPGDEVICPTYTFFATAMPLFQLGALPVLADCDPDGDIDPLELDRLMTRSTKAVVVTHMWGLPCRLDEIREFCDRRGLFLVEDCSHAHGATYKGQLVGSHGHAAVWSLQGKKIISAGEGGILLTDDDELYDRAQLLGHFNRRAMEEIEPSKTYYRYAVTGLGLKYRAHPLGIAFALTQLPLLASWLRGKSANGEHLDEIVTSVHGVTPLDPRDAARESSRYAYVFTVDAAAAGFTRDQLLGAMRAENFADIEVPVSGGPLDTLAAFQRPISPVASYRVTGVRGPYPEAGRIARTSLRLSVPVETSKGSCGEQFLAQFEAVWTKVTRRLAMLVSSASPACGEGA